VAKKRKSMAGDLRFIAERLDGVTPRFATVIRAAAKEISELRWENGVLRRKLKLRQPSTTSAHGDR
jgi:hypothetical protein